MKFSFIIVLLFLIALLQMTTDLYLPAMPAIGSYFNASNNTIQHSLSLFVFGMSLSHLLFAPLSDRIGRKPPILLAVAISTLGSFICFQASTLNYFLGGRFLQGLGIGCFNSVGRSLTRDKFNGKQLAKLGSLIGMFSILLMIIAPILGGYLITHAPWKMLFGLLIILDCSVFLIALIWLPETNKALNTTATSFKTLYTTIIILINKPSFIRNTLCSSFASAGLVAWFTVSAFVLSQQFGLSPIDIGIQNIYIAAAVLCSALLNVRLIDRVGVNYMLTVGIRLKFISACLLIFFLNSHYLNLTIFMSLISLFALGCGLIFINAFTKAFERVGAYAGVAGMLYALSQDGFASLSSLVIATSDQNKLLTLSSLFFILALCSMICNQAFYQVAKEST